MTTLEADVRRSIRTQTWLVSDHAENQLDERRIEAWHVAAASEAGTTVGVFPHAVPHAKVDIVGSLPDGTSVRAVWAWLPTARRARLITAYFTGTR